MATNETETLLYVTVISITSILSLVGAATIIISYIALPSIRTTARQMLVYLAVADIILALSTLIGATVFYGKADSIMDSPMTYRLCETQAAFTIFGVLSTLFWTVAIAIHLFILAVLRSQRWQRIRSAAFHVVCWGVPAVLTVWLGAANHLGIYKGATNGFCAIVPGDAANGYYVIVIGYDMWLYMAILLLPSLYFAVHCHVKRKLRQSGCKLVYKRDLKLLFVPIVFLFLRFWSIIVDVLIYYDPDSGYKGSRASVVIGILEGVGLAGQGFANGLLFSLMTKKIRAFLFCSLCCCHRYGQSTGDKNTNDEDSDAEAKPFYKYSKHEMDNVRKSPHAKISDDDEAA